MTPLPYLITIRHPYRKYHPPPPRTSASLGIASSNNFNIHIAPDSRCPNFPNSPTSIRNLSPPLPLSALHVRLPNPRRTSAITADSLALHPSSFKFQAHPEPHKDFLAEHASLLLLAYVSISSHALQVFIYTETLALVHAPTGSQWRRVRVSLSISSSFAG
ncbi:unnamed protein product [Cyclocybe aegerita]|uniref:Uncharacterized protein n=1 Tax=Cyclocybe aegerita TaxID=1973307 RepID=A0A8S0X603_CYCAE|nr:unnamed protein product [Cyclocybe aegerita]